MKNVVFSILILLFFQAESQNLTFSKEGKWGICNKNGKVLYPAQADYIYKTLQNLYVIRIGNLEGLANDSGKIIIPAEYNKIEVFSNFFALKKSKWALADKQGKLLTEFEYSGIHEISPNYLLLNHPAKQQVYNALTQTSSKPFERIRYLNLFNEVNKSGLRFYSQNTIGSLHSDSLTPVCSCTNCEDAWTDGDFGITEEANGLHFFYQKNKYSYDKIFTNYLRISSKVIVAKTRNGDCYLVNMHVKKIQEPVQRCESIYYLTDSLYTFSSNKKFGIINYLGEVVVQDLTGKPFLRSDGYIEFNQNERIGLMNRQLKTVVPNLYYAILPFENKHAVATKDNSKFGLISENGSIILPFEYNQIKNFGDKVKAYKDGGMMAILFDENNYILDSSFYSNVKTVAVENKNNASQLQMLSINRTNANEDIVELPTDSLVQHCKGYKIISTKQFITNRKIKSPIPGAGENIWRYVGLEESSSNKIILAREFWDIRLADLYVGKNFRIINKYGKSGLYNIETNRITYSLKVELGGKKINSDITYIGFFHNGLARAYVGGILLMGTDIKDLALPYHNKSFEAKNGTWVYLNANGTIANSQQFDYASDFHHGQAIVAIKGKYGIIDSNFKWIVPPIHPKLSFLKGSNFKIYQIERSSKEIGIIDYEGRLIVQGGFTKIAIPYDGLLAVQKNNVWGFVNRKGEIVLEPQFAGACSFSEGLAAVKKGTFWNYIDESGKVIIELPIQKADAFHQGVAAVIINNRWNLIKKDGSLVTKTGFDIIKEYYNGVWLASKNKKWGLINKEGKWCIPAKHEKVKFIAPYRIFASFAGKGWFLYNFENTPLNKNAYTSIHSFNEGYSAVECKKKWGYIDSTGKLAIEAIYEFAGSFSENLAMVRNGRKIGYVNTTGKLVIPNIYIEASNFINGKALVRIKGENCFYIDPEGKEIYRTNSINFPNGVLRGNYYLLFQNIYNGNGNIILSNIASIRSISNNLFKLVRYEKNNTQSYKIQHPVVICQQDMTILQEVRELSPYSNGYFKYTSLKQYGAISFNGTMISEAVNGKIEFSKNLIKISNWANVEWRKSDGSPLLENSETDSK